MGVASAKLLKTKDLGESGLSEDLRRNLGGSPMDCRRIFGWVMSTGLGDRLGRSDKLFELIDLGRFGARGNTGGLPKREIKVR